VRLHPDQKFDLKRENLSDTTNGPPPTGSPPPRTPSSGSLEVRSIKFQIVNPWLESICLEADAPFTPVIFGLDDGKPRIVMDVSGTAPLTLPAVIPRDGLIVGSIRAHHDPAQNRLRIVLDLNSSGNIAVEPVFFEDLNTCCLGLRNRAMTPSTKGDLPRPSIEIKKP